MKILFFILVLVVAQSVQSAPLLILQPTGRALADPLLAPRPITPEFREGTFEEVDARGFAEGFEPYPTQSVKIAEENGNHFMRLICVNPNNQVSAGGVFKVDPQWKLLKLSAILRTSNLKLGQNPWDTARVNLSFLDKNGQQILPFPKVPELHVDSDWTPVATTNVIPQGTYAVRVQPAFINATGVFDVDNIRLEGATNLEELAKSQPLRHPFLEGTFEQINNQGVPDSWTLDNPAQMKIMEENGNRYLRLTNEVEGATVMADGRFKLNPQWRAVKISAWMRTANLRHKPGRQPWETARLGFIFENTSTERVGEWPATLDLHQNANWTLLTTHANIPRAAVFLRLQPILQSTRGIFDVDDITVEPAQPNIPPAPVCQWTRAFPEGTFEHVDEEGNPLGWQLQGQPAQVIEEEDNRFLRLINNDVRSTVLVSSKIALVPTWKAVRVRARLRGTKLESGVNPLDSARLQLVFVNPQGETLPAMPPALSFPKDKYSDWVDLHAKGAVPPGANIIQLIISLSRTAGTLDVDDILIEPAAE